MVIFRLSNILRYLPDVVLSTFAIIFIAIRLNTTAPSNTSASECGLIETALADRAMSVGSDAVELNAWVPAPIRKCWRAYALVLAARQITDRTIHVTPRAIEVLERSSAHLFEQAAAIRGAPDIGFVDTRAFVDLAKQGYLAPLDDCRTRHTEFADVYEDLWSHVTWEGKTWGVPVEIGVGIFYFNKEKLRTLYWTPYMIETLPQRIRDGAWTLDDMLDTVRQARELGVIDAGEGFWPNYHRNHTLWLVYLAYNGRIYDDGQAKLVVNSTALMNAYRFHHTLLQEELMPTSFTGRDSLSSWPGGAIWRDSEAHGQPLFWQGSMEFWRDYIDAAPEIGETGMFTRTGFALFPSANAGNPGHSWAHAFDWYVIASEQASGRRRQDDACAVLAKTLMPEIHALNLRQSSSLGALKTQTTHPALITDLFNASTSYLWDYTVASPGHHPAYRTYNDIVMQFLARVENGELMPETAADAAILRLQNEVGNEILVE